MNLIKRDGGFSSLIPDLVIPSPLLGRDLFNFDFDLIPSRLGFNVPTANITENQKEFIVELAAPGLKQKDFNIEIENNMLKISSELEDEKKEGEGEYSRREYSYRSFSRVFALPDNIKEEDTKAKYEDGILKVHIPKKTETPAKPVHKIEVS